MIANCPSQHRIFYLERIEHRTLTHRSFNFELEVAINASKRT